MTSNIESTKRQMFIALAKLKAGGRWLLKKQNADAFETALEEHLEASRQELERWKASDKKTGEMILFNQGEAQREREQHEETQRQLHEMTRLRECFERLAVDYTKESISLEDENKSLKAGLDEALGRVEIYGDAHRYQVKLTHEACCRERVLFDELHEARRKAAVYVSDCRHAEKLADDRHDRIEELRKLVESQRKAYASLHQLKFGISPAQDEANVLKTKAEALAIIRGDGQASLEAVNRTLVAQVEELTRELDVLKEANKVAGEELRIAGFKVVSDDRTPEVAVAMIGAGGKVEGFWQPQYD